MQQNFLDEKDNFILSDRNTFEIPEIETQKPVAKMRLPARYEIIDKVNKWGSEMVDPLAVRQLSNVELEDDIIMTSKEDKNKSDIAIR